MAQKSFLLIILILALYVYHKWESTPTQYAPYPYKFKELENKIKPNSPIMLVGYVPGRLFSVNPLTARHVPNLFARNERLVCLFDTEYGPMAIVLVGAMIVASIETVWAGLITPHKREIRSVRYDEPARAPIRLERGAEMGRFKLGSTVIVLFGPNRIRWSNKLLQFGPVKMGQALAHPK